MKREMRKCSENKWNQAHTLVGVNGIALAMTVEQSPSRRPTVYERGWWNVDACSKDREQTKFHTLSLLHALS